MNLVDALAFILAGFTLVLVTLALLWLVSAVIGRVFAVGSRRSTQAPANPAPALAEASGIPPAHVAAIAAAVAVVTAGRGRVVTVRVPGHASAGWSIEGRSDHSSSHGNRVRWDWAMPGPPHIDHRIPGSPPVRKIDHQRIP